MTGPSSTGGTYPTRVTVTHSLSARAVLIDESAIQGFTHRGVELAVEARQHRPQAFATIICSGSVQIPPGQRPTARGGALAFASTGTPLDAHQDVVNQGWELIEPALVEVGSVLRWRFGMFGADALWTSTQLVLETGDRSIEFSPTVQAVFGDDMSRIVPGGLGQVANMVDAATLQPLAHEMWREAWNLQHSSPRSSLVVGVAAAEVGLKQLVALLVPDAESLVRHMPSPPLDVMIRQVLPELPARSGVTPDRLCPQRIRKRLIDAVQARNKVVHRGDMPALPLWDTLKDVREFLYLLDLHSGHDWAESLLSDDTRAALHPA